MSDSDSVADCLRRKIGDGLSDVALDSPLAGGDPMALPHTVCVDHACFRIIETNDRTLACTQKGEPKGVSGDSEACFDLTRCLHKND